MEIKLIFKLAFAFFVGVLVLTSSSFAQARCLKPYDVRSTASGLNLNSTSIGNIVHIAQRKLARNVHVFMGRNGFKRQRGRTYSLRVRCQCYGSPRRYGPGDRIRVKCRGRVSICPGPAIFYHPKRCRWVGWR